MRIVDEDHVFKFKGLCPYCGGNLYFHAEGWDKHPAKTFWKGTSFYWDCSTEPEDIMSDEWDEWMNQHSDMPYVNMLPVQTRVERYIGRNYRFRLKE